MFRLSHLLILSFFTISGCASTNIFNKTAQLTDVTSSWLNQNCSDSDWRNSSEFRASNCSVVSTEVKGVAYTCNFSEGQSRGLFKKSTDGLDLLCGVEAGGVDPIGTVYTDGSSDTSGVGKALVATAAVVAIGVVAAAVANNAGASNYKAPSKLNYSNCSCPYDTASDGSRCGARSAWSRKGGAAPICDFTLLTYEDYTEKQ